MTKFTLTAITAIANCDLSEGITQDAILCHTNTDEFGDGDCIIFGYNMNEFATDEDVEEVLLNETCPTYSSIREDGVYLANA